MEDIKSDDVEKYIDNEMKKIFMPIRKKIVEIEEKVIRAEELSIKNMNNYKTIINSNVKDGEYSNEIKQLISDDIDERNDKLLNEINEVLPSLMKQGNNNLYYVFILMATIFMLIVLFLIFKM